MPGKTKPLLSASVPEAEKPVSDEQFIRLAFNKDPSEGCALLFREYYGPLCSHASRYVYSREAAHDIVSEIFCIFWQQELYRKITFSYRAYLYTAVRNRSLKYLQRELGTTFLPESPSADSEEGDGLINALTPEDLMAFDELHHRLESAIQQLPPQRQRVFLMSRFEGKKYQTIAEELHISLKAVEAHIGKALTSLRKVLSIF